LEEHWTNKKGPGMLKIQLANLPEDEEVLTIPAHKSMLYIALNNIIDNAFKYSALLPVILNFEATASHIKIAITDGGTGISKEDVQKIFRPFYRVNRDKSIAGSGIGLYITSKIIELFKGTIQVISVSGRGSTFVVEFLRNKASV
jgi:signal transduction histidine kinase